MTTTNAITSGSIGAAAGLNNDVSGAYPGALTPDGLMIYLQTRLEGLDQQISLVFDHQQKMDSVRSLLNKLQTELNKLNGEGDRDALQGTQTNAPDPNQVLLGAKNALPWGHGNAQGAFSPVLGNLPQTPPAEPKLADFEANIENILDQIGDIDPNLANEMRGELTKEGQILYCEDGLYKCGEVKASTSFVDGMLKDAEASMQLNMIKLQSAMSARQTAIQLSTNLVSALGESMKAIAANIRG